MTQAMLKVVIVGGGTAGWLTAAVVAAERHARADGSVEVTLVESPDIPTIGVGEGTWPSMRRTLQHIGLSERTFLETTGASFKQGTRFVGWSGRPDDDTYYHPFNPPAAYARSNLASVWLAHGTKRSFAEYVSPQPAVIDRGLAPKQAGMPDYAFAVNYAYHLDAGCFAELLRDHSTRLLGVRHVLANVTDIGSKSDGDIDVLHLDNGEHLPGSLFIDCTGHRSLLLGEHYGVDLVPVDDVLFNDRAIAVQVPHAAADTPIASATLSTATPMGWIWDIGLQQRRGLGHVYASRFTSEEEAKAHLKKHIESDDKLDTAMLNDASYRTLRFSPGHRRTFWKRNCVAVGQSAGFIEPLEASAIALVEQSAAMIAAELPRDRRIMDIVARRFNDKLAYHWRRIIEFLKLHYAVSERQDSAYWRAHRDPETWPDGLADKILLWQQQSPNHLDAPMIDELFPSASYQYVLYGMGFRPCYTMPNEAGREVEDALQEVRDQQQKLLNHLAPNRNLIEELLGQQHE